MKEIAAILMMSAMVMAIPMANAGEAAHTGIAPPTRIPDPVDDLTARHGVPIATSAIPRAVRRAVVADAARRFTVLSSAVVLIQAEQITWPDGALGCPEPGRRYPQTRVAGFRLVAKTTEGQLLYHTDAFGSIASCASAPLANR